MPYSQPAPTVQPLCHWVWEPEPSASVTDRRLFHAGVAALRVEQIVIHGDTSPARDRRHPVGAPAELIVAGTKHGVAHGTLVIETRDRALEAEHKIVGLPIVTYLAAAEDARIALTETLAGREVAERRGVGGVDPPLVGPGAANVAADIEAAPVEDRFNVGRRLGVRPRAEIGGRRRAHPERRSEGQRGNQFRMRHSAPHVVAWGQAFPERPYQLEIDAAGEVEFSLRDIEFRPAVATAQLFCSV